MKFKPEDFGAIPNNGNIDNGPAFTEMFNSMDFNETRPVV